MAQNTAGQTLTINPSQSGLEVIGKDVFDATAIVTTDYVEITCGFQPNYVCWENQTDLTKGEWYVGMAADSAIKTIAAGTRSALGSNGITVTPRGFRVSQNATSALILASKTCLFTARV